MESPREKWLKIALRHFPHRHSKISAVKQNALGMLRSMFAHGKNWRLWKEGKLKVKDI